MKKLKKRDIPGPKSSELLEISKQLSACGALIEAETRFLIMLKIGGSPCSLFPGGRWMERGTNDKGEAREVAQKIVDCLSGIVE